MPRLQSCPKCAAQLDVTAFAAGQQFTCGACGAVVTTAGGPSRAVPPPSAPSRPVPAPSAGAGKRGPQYQPVERRGGAAASASAGASSGGSSRRARAGDEGDLGDDAGGASSRRRGARSSAPKKGNPLVFAGVGVAVLVLALVAFLATQKKDEPTDTTGGAGGTSVASSGSGQGSTAGTSGTQAPGGANPGGAGGAPAAPGAAPATADTPASVLAEFEADKFPSLEHFRSYLRRLVALGAPGAENAKVVAVELLAKGDPNDKDAHALLGHKEFVHPIPDEIFFDKYPFIRAVREANEKHWFDDAEAYEMAMRAWERTQLHAKRLTDDREYAALDEARSLIDRDTYFKNYNYDAIFASPYLICYSTNERIDPEAFINLPKEERKKKLAELDAKKAKYQRILAEKARIYPQLYKEFLKRYGDICELHPLMDEFGGRADYPISKRSFRLGCPLIVWIFSDNAAFKEYHEKVKGDPISEGVAGYFSPETGWIYLYDEESDSDAREFEINKNVHEGTHQLQHWFTKQKNEWGPVRIPQSWFGEGFAEYLGSVIMNKDRDLKFTGINRPRLKTLQNIDAQAKQQGKKNLPIFPIKQLVGFEGYNTVQTYAVEHLGINPGFGLGLFYVQSWAFTYFLNEANNGKYRKKFELFLDDVLNYPRDSPGYGFEKFKMRFGILNDDGFKSMEKEFLDFYLNDLLKKDLASIGPSPPNRDDWPNYEPPESLDATGKAAKKPAEPK